MINCRHAVLETVQSPESRIDMPILREKRASVTAKKTVIDALLMMLDYFS